MKLQGAIAVVTGGARGIGKAITIALLKNKSKVYILDIDAEEGKIVQALFDKEYGEGMAKFIQCDVRDAKKFEEIISDAVKQEGRLDILCNNAGIGPTDDIEKLISINLTSLIRGTLLGVQYMDNSNGGHGGSIINMGSAGGLCYVPNSNCAYIASKHGVVGFTKTFAQVAIKVGVRVNCICPSITDTDLLKNSIKRDPSIQQLIDTFGVQSPDIVSKGFIQLINDEEKVGEAMRVTMANGIDYHSFSEEQVPL